MDDIQVEIDRLFREQKDAWKAYDDYIEAWLDGKVERDIFKQSALLETAVCLEGEYIDAKRKKGEVKHGNTVR